MTPVFETIFLVGSGVDFIFLWFNSWLFRRGILLSFTFQFRQKSVYGKFYNTFILDFRFGEKLGYGSRYSDSPQTGRSGDLISVEEFFFAPVHTDIWGPSSLPCHGYWLSFPGDKAAEAWCWPPTSLWAKVQDRVKLNIYCPLGLQDLF
jgi:hypothetical protein